MKHQLHNARRTRSMHARVRPFFMSFGTLDVFCPFSVPQCLRLSCLLPLERGLLRLTGVPQVASPPGWCSPRFWCLDDRADSALNSMHNCITSVSLFWLQTVSLLSLP